MGGMKIFKMWYLGAFLDLTQEIQMDLNRVDNHDDNWHKQLERLL